MVKKALGKGLEALITSAGSEDKGVIELKINEIEPNLNQPRKAFDDDKLLQLAESIKQNGVVQPIIVKKEGNIYRIIAGERRWRAARIAGLMNIPVVVKDVSDKQVMEIALIENLQREDLNPIEEAEAFDKLLKEHSLTQEEVSKTVGRSRPAVANSLRLLGLSESIKDKLIKGIITSGHARAALAIEDKEFQEKLINEVIARSLNVRETEKLVKKMLDTRISSDTNKKSVQNAEEYAAIEDSLKRILGTKVQLLKNRNKGKILIEYYSLDELDRLLEIFNNIGAK